MSSNGYVTIRILGRDVPIPIEDARKHARELDRLADEAERLQREAARTFGRYKIVKQNSGASWPYAIASNGYTVALIALEADAITCAKALAKEESEAGHG